MFDDVKFSGTINLGNLVNAVVVLIGSIALYFRIKGELAAHERKTGQKIETSLRKRLVRPRKIKPLDVGGQSGDSEIEAKQEDNKTDDG